MRTIRFAAGLALVSAMLCFATLNMFAQPGIVPAPPPPGSASAALPPPPPDFGNPGHVPEIPDLTGAQKEQLKKLRLALDEKTLTLHTQLGEKEARLRTLTTAKKIQSDDIDRVVDEIGSLGTQLFKAHVMMDLRVRELLNDEQRLFFDTHPRPRGPRPPGM